MSPIRLDLGCGKKKRAGYVGIDSAATSHADLLADIERGIPLRADSCEAILCDNLLEHMRDLIPVMNEIWRVARHGAAIEIIVPYYLWAGAYQDPTHVRFFTEKTFLYFNRSLPYDYGFVGKFDIKSVELVANPEFAQELPNIPQAIAMKYFMNAVKSMIVHLVADKRFPGAPV